MTSKSKYTPPANGVSQYDPIVIIKRINGIKCICTSVYVYYFLDLIGAIV